MITNEKKTVVSNLVFSLVKAKRKEISKTTQNGVLIIYPCGTKRFISNSWYDENDINNL